MAHWQCVFHDMRGSETVQSVGVMLAVSGVCQSIVRQSHTGFEARGWFHHAKKKAARLPPGPADGDVADCILLCTC